MRPVDRVRTALLDQTLRQQRGLRRMAGGGFDGRVEIAAPIPERPRGERYQPGSYTPLEPWGYPNPDGSTYGMDGWVGLHRTEAEALGYDTPFLDFGVGDDSEDQAVGLIGVTSDFDDFFEMVVSENRFLFWAEVANDASSDNAFLYMDLNEMGQAQFQCQPSIDGGFYVQVSPISYFSQFYGEAGYIEHLTDDERTYVHLIGWDPSTPVFLGLSEASAPGSTYSGGGTARGGFLWIEDAGGGKSRLVVQFNETAKQTIITET
jgi:hypothetical protein